MTFKKLIQRSHPGANDVAVPKGNSDQTWAIYQMIRDAAPSLGLKPKVMQTLAAMISCLRQGRGTICFASTRELMRRLAGVSERTIRRHVMDLVEIGILKRRDSPNCKRYVSRGTSSGDSIAFGFDLQPMIDARDRWLGALELHNRNALECRHLATQIKDLLARLEKEDVDPGMLADARKCVRRKLPVDQLRELRDRLRAFLSKLIEKTIGDGASQRAPIPLPRPESQADIDLSGAEGPAKMAGSGGQNDRDHSRSKTEEIDKKGSNASSVWTQGEVATLLEKLSSACPDALCFAERPLRTESDIVLLGRQLAPMIGIRSALHDEASSNLGAIAAAVSVMVMVNMHGRIRNMEAYFRSLISGKRRESFDPFSLLDRFATASKPS
ncbi:plasmid replication protein RepC [Falsirhodobacter sp. 1013]|uniref:plasmid replication protein RepC n=1 Tax=Falsirhodobacter sp. 1013 TaxID=3417566 RepID=UPI003EC01201